MTTPPGTDTKRAYTLEDLDPAPVPTYYRREYLSRHGWVGCARTYTNEATALEIWAARRERWGDDTGKERIVGTRPDGSRFILVHNCKREPKL